VGDRLRSRRWAAALLVALLPVATASCASDGGDEGATEVRAETERPDPVGEPVDLSAAGLHELPSPPHVEEDAPTGAAVRVWTGTELIVWGGQVAVDSSAPGRIVGEGAALSLDDGRWTPLPPSPYPDGLYRPLGAWDGDELIVIGTRCDLVLPPSTDGGAPACPNGPAAMAFDPATFRWRTLPVPPIPVDPDLGVAAASRGAAVGAEGGVAFAFDYRAEAIAWDRARGSWTTIGPPAEDVPSTEVCADEVDGRLVAVASNPPGVETTIPAWALAPGSPAWTALGRFGVSTDWRVTCSDGRATTMTYSGGRSRASLVDLASGATEELFGPDGAAGLGDVWSIGPWVFTERSEITEVTPDEELSSARLDVRLAEGGDWQTIESFEDEERGLRSARLGAGSVHLPGIGAIGGGDGELLLWRAPEELQP
jgi:hypothetical protein